MYFHGCPLVMDEGINVSENLYQEYAKWIWELLKTKHAVNLLHGSCKQLKFSHTGVMHLPESHKYFCCPLIPA